MAETSWLVKPPHLGKVGFIEGDVPRTPRTHMLHVSRVLDALILHVPPDLYVLVLHVPHALRAVVLEVSRALRTFVSCALRTLMPLMLSF